MAGQLTKQLIGKEDLSIQYNTNDPEQFSRLNSVGGTINLYQIPDVWTGTGKINVGKIEIEGHILPLPATYTVFKSGSTYYAISGTDSLPNYSNTNFVDLMDAVMLVVGCNGTSYKQGNKVIIREGWYALTKSWDIPPTQDFELDAGTCGFGYTPVTGAAILIDSFMNCRFKFGMVIASNGTNEAVVNMKPRTVGPDSLTIGIVSDFIFDGIVNASKTNTALMLDASFGSINSNRISINEIADSLCGIEAVINAPSLGEIVDNHFFLSAHNVTNGIKVGASGANSISRNMFYATLKGDGTGVGLDIYNDSSIYHVSCYGFNANQDIILRVSADNNLFIGQFPDGFTDSSATTTNKIIDQNQGLYLPGIPIYVNNAGALAGGLKAGQFYRLNADPDHLCIVH